jgi:predicted thioesterase
MTNDLTVGLTAGLTGHAQSTVTADLTAIALGSGDVPVYATPALIALLEAAAVDAVAGHLAPETTSVGTHLDVRHLAATPVGMAVRATATLSEVAGRKLTFTLEAHDEVEQIASGTHQRMVVDRARFIQSVENKTHK